MAALARVGLALAEVALAEVWTTVSVTVSRRLALAEVALALAALTVSVIVSVP